MFRLWGKIYKNNDIIADHVYEQTSSDSTLEEMTKKGVEFLCDYFDLQKPMWFSNNKNDYNQIGKTQFADDHFIETIDFDYLEIEIIEHTN